MALIRSAAELMEKDENQVTSDEDTEFKSNRKIGRIRGRIKARQEKLIEEPVVPEEEQTQEEDQEQEEKTEDTDQEKLKGVLETIEKLKALNSTAPSAKIIADTIQYSHELS
jgi:beta-phosphoglucomutase-like phosphatase (HAD superfamily)